MRPCIHPYIYASFHVSMHPCIHPFISASHVSIHSSVRPMYPSTHPSFPLPLAPYLPCSVGRSTVRYVCPSVRLSASIDPSISFNSPVYLPVMSLMSLMFASEHMFRPVSKTAEWKSSVYTSMALCLVQLALGPSTTQPSYKLCYINNSLHLARKYARILVRGHYLSGREQFSESKARGNLWALRNR